MRDIYSIMADLDRCVGCHACEIACKQEHGLPPGLNWIKVLQVGPEEVDGRLRMEFIPVMLDGCIMCADKDEDSPACVVNCPTDALVVVETAEMLRLLSSGGRYRLCKIRERPKTPTARTRSAIC
jgi:Fe-S-cluster-containing dehydrogenase component